MKSELALIYGVVEAEEAASSRRVPPQGTAAHVATRLMQRLHDGPTQLMTLALLELDQVRQAEQAVRGSGMQVLGCVRSLVREALRDTRQVLQEWGGGVEEEPSMSLANSLIHLGRRLSSLTGLALHIDCEEAVFDPPPRVTAIVLQAAQELLLNTCKHAPGASAKLELTMLAGGFELMMSDDGPGFDPVAVYQRHSVDGGLGLGSMPERLAHVEASFNLQTGPGTGVQARIRWPGDFAEHGCSGRRIVRLPGRMTLR